MTVCKFLRSISLCAALALPVGAFAGGNPGHVLTGSNHAEAVTAGGVKDASDTKLVTKALHALTDVMVRDITAPPVASRSYVYCMLAFYEAARPGDSSFESFGGNLNGLEKDSLPRPIGGQTYDWMVAGAEAFHLTAHALVFSKDLFEQKYDSVDQQIQARHRSNIDKATYVRSIAYGMAVATAILHWAAQDAYGYTRTLPRFTPSKDSATWKQTGPEYMEAVEPHWDQIRSMTLAKSHQFSIPDPAPFKSAAFIKEYTEVYEQSKHLTEDQTALALFWDCNPYAVQSVGHLMYSIKKISPGGHWMGITGIAIQNAGIKLIPALYAYALVSIGVFDGFISAWDEKYRTNYLRPITAIQQSLDPTWQPLLQTPPFPEYPSAHSVISMSAATILTVLFGDSIAYTDNTELAFGLPSRHFQSFRQAAAEAAVSRMYGGIHFREAIENGKTMGSLVGDQIVQKLKVHYVAIQR